VLAIRSVGRGRHAIALLAFHLIAPAFVSATARRAEARRIIARV